MSASLERDPQQCFIQCHVNTFVYVNVFWQVTLISHYVPAIFPMCMKWLMEHWWWILLYLRRENTHSESGLLKMKGKLSMSKPFSLNRALCLKWTSSKKPSMGGWPIGSRLVCIGPEPECPWSWYKLSEKKLVATFVQIDLQIERYCWIYITYSDIQFLVYPLRFPSGRYMYSFYWMGSYQTH